MRGSGPAYAQNSFDREFQSSRSASINNDIIERAAEALFEFVFAGCDRLDGKRHWADCSEDTKAGFRSEANAVLEAIWPVTANGALTIKRVG